jgi:hypothetical protein
MQANNPPGIREKRDLEFYRCASTEPTLMLPPSASDLRSPGGQTHNDRHMVDSYDVALSTNSMKWCAANAVIAALPKNSA